MITFHRSAGAMVAALAVFALASGPAAAAKMTYEQAFGKCKEEIKASAPGNDSLSVAQRSTAGGACMKKYGFRLKKKNAM